MVITIELNAVPNNILQHNELKPMIDSFHLTFQKEFAEVTRAAQSAIRTVDIAEINSAAKQLANAVSGIYSVDYNAELRETAKTLASIISETKPMVVQLQETLRSAKPMLKQIELETADARKQWIVNLQLLGQVLEDAALVEDDFEPDEPEEDCLDEETADYLATIVSQVQTVTEPESAVPLEQLRTFFSGITWEKAKAILEAIVLIISLVQGFIPDEDLQRNNELTETLIVQEQEADARTHEQNERIIEQNEQIIELLSEIRNQTEDSGSVIAPEVVLPEPTDEVSEQSCSDESHDGQQ